MGRAARRALPIAVLLGAAVYWLATAVALVTASGQGFDFATYYGAALAMRDQPSANIYDQRVIQAAAIAHHAQVPGDSYLYPPVLAVLQVPLTLLPYGAARLVWIVVNLACWLGCALLLAALLRDALAPARVRGDAAGSGGGVSTAGLRQRLWRGERGERGESRADAWLVWAIAALVSLVYLPFSLTLGYGEINGIILLLLLLALALERRGRPGLAGGLLGVAVAIKLFPLVVVGYYALRGRWRVVYGALSSCLALALLTVIVVGPGGIAHARLALTNASNHVLRPSNEALVRAPYWIARLFGGTPGPLTLAIGYALAGAVGIAFVAGLLRAEGVWKRARGTRAMREEADEEARELVGYGWALCTMVLVSPVTWEHHAVWLLPAFIISLGVAIRWLAQEEPLRLARARGAWVGLVVGVLGYALMMDQLPFNFDLSLSQGIGPYLLGIPLRPVFMLVRPAAAGLVWLALGLLFVRPGGWTAQRPLPLCRAPASPANGERGDRRQRGLSVDALLVGTLASLAVGIVVVAGTYTTVQALVH